MGAINFAFLQVASVLITVFVYLQFKTTTSWLSFLYAFSLTHFILAVYYSRNNIAAKRNQNKTWVPLILLAIFGSYLYETAFPLLFYFGAHHVLNDVYNRFNHSKLKINRSNIKWITVSALTCNALGWLTILEGSESVFGLDGREPYVVVFIISLVFHVYLLSRQDIENKKSFILSNTSSELLYLCLIPLSFVYRIELYHVIFYHGTIWGLLPIFKFNAAKNIEYISLSILITLAFLAVSPIGFRALQIPFEYYIGLFNWFTYFHITLAFATSSAHPVWVNRLFGNKLQY